MKTLKLIIALSFLILTIETFAQSSAFGSGFDVQEFYNPFTVEEITPENMQKWPYYKYVSANWDDYAIHGTTKVNKSSNPTNKAHEK